MKVFWIKIQSWLSHNKAWLLIRDTCAGWAQDNAPRLGAALAFYSILSLVPLLLLFLSVASFVWGSETAHGQITRQIVSIFGEHAAESMQNVLNATAENKNAGIITSVVSFLTLIFSASGMFGELQSAMNYIWKTKPKEGRALFTLAQDRLFSFLMVLGTGAILVATVLISAFFGAAQSYIERQIPAAHIFMQLGDILLSFSILTCLFTVLFKFVPNTPIEWRSVWPGGMLTAFLFVIGKVLIGFYLGHIGVTSTYGAAGSLVALLIWIYYSAQILFFGAEFTYVYSTPPDRRAKQII